MELWEKCVSFHGHSCGGLRIGYAAALYAMELLNIRFSDNEQVVCISENDACGVDAIQVALGCSIGKGCSCPTDFPSFELDKSLTETQIVLMSVLASEVAFQVHRKVS